MSIIGLVMNLVLAALLAAATSSSISTASMIMPVIPRSFSDARRRRW